MINPPFVAVVAGHTRVTAMLAEVVTGHVIEVAAVTTFVVQLSMPVAPKEVVTEQTLAGTV